MATPPISNDVARATLAAVEQCLKEGFGPPHTKSPKGSATEEAAKRLIAAGMLKSRSSMTSRIRSIAAMGMEPNWSLYSPEKPRFRVKAGSTNPEPLPSELRIRQLESVIDNLRAENRGLRKAELDAHIVREAILGLDAQTPEPPDWLLGTDGARDTPGVPMTLWSDWHWGEVVRPEEVGGVNAFNLDIAHQRAKRLVERIVHLSFDHAVNAVYPGIVVMLGGDMISGEIHDELTETNEARTAPALIDLQGVLISALETMADRFGRVFVPCVVGNHGRMTQKPRAKGRVHTSFEWLLYCQLERYFRDDPRIRFHIPGEADAHFTVAGQRVMLTHGDSLGTRGGDGIIGALGPITRGVIKTRYSEAQIGRDFDFCCMGHWHQWMPLHDRGFVVNGALKGYDEYARLFLRARYERPIQGLWFLHPAIGVTSVKPIYLDDQQRSAPADSWVAWAA